jgi:hypothetical protein
MRGCTPARMNKHRTELYKKRQTDRLGPLTLHAAHMTIPPFLLSPSYVRMIYAHLHLVHPAIIMYIPSPWHVLSTPRRVTLYSLCADGTRRSVSPASSAASMCGLVCDRCGGGRTNSADTRGESSPSPGLVGRAGRSCSDGTASPGLVGRSPGERGAMSPSLRSRRCMPSSARKSDARGRVSA